MTNRKLLHRVKELPPVWRNCLPQ